MSTKISEESAQACRNRRLPLVLVDSCHEQFDSITVDNQAGALLAIQYLMRIGYRQFALLAGPRENFSAQLRFQDCRHALRKAGVGLPDKMILGDHQEQSGYLALKNFLEQPGSNSEARKLPLAVFVTSELQILGAIKAIQQAGLHIPDDVVLIGFENSALAEYAGLMTVRQPLEEIGYRAVECLLARLENPDSPPQRLSLQPELVVRKNWGAKKQAFEKFSHMASPRAPF
ncbi:MAG: HTH-type transcriptional repressor PurR [bacterium]|nr:HTH-type transcriptional repressor PurR [bacterium]